MKYLLVTLVIVAFVIIANPKYVSSDPDLNSSNTTAQAGNTTLLNFGASQDTEIWQGFFGSISGGILLEDADGETMYDWSSITPAGEVFATRFIISDWTKVNCTNQTQIYNEETRLGITTTSSDSINNTYTNTTHPNFDVAGRIMTGCRSTLTDNSTNREVVFWNILLNSNATTTIYSSIIDSDTVGFNGTVTDYQLLVPVNKSIGQSTYNFYLEVN